MEADWSVEIGPGLPVIVVPWEGFHNLRREPAGISRLSEAAVYPALGSILQQLNTAPSRLLTSKCDVWPLGFDKIDPDEFGARPPDATAGIAAYIDVISLTPPCFASFPWHEDWMRRAVDRLRRQMARQARVDLVLRQAFVEESEGFGVTLYAAGCGENLADAERAWQHALEAAAAATISISVLQSATGE